LAMALAPLRGIDAGVVMEESRRGRGRAATTLVAGGGGNEQAEEGAARQRRGGGQSEGGVAWRCSVWLGLGEGGTPFICSWGWGDG
jgi:hypothetical protein